MPGWDRVVGAGPKAPGIPSVERPASRVRESPNQGIPWIRGGHILYWGDLDSNGFAILNQLRATCPDVTSMLMDTATLDRFRTLAVVEPKPHRGQLSRLTPSEQDALVALRANGDLRLEQERIAWPYALDAILTAIVR
jgi:hypothetical protein